MANDNFSPLPGQIPDCNKTDQDMSCLIKSAHTGLSSISKHCILHLSILPCLGSRPILILPRDFSKGSSLDLVPEIQLPNFPQQTSTCKCWLPIILSNVKCRHIIVFSPFPTNLLSFFCFPAKVNEMIRLPSSL